MSLPGERVDLVPTVPFEEPTIPTSPVKQFYPGMRFPDRMITYRVENECSAIKKAQVAQAFATLQRDTVLEFSEEIDGRIQVICSELAPEPKLKKHFVAGEGGPTEIVNTTLYSVILSGKISLYRDESCTTPHIALHEILHVLGFDHTQDSGSILYPTLNCGQRIDQAILDEIDRLYSVDSNPDFQITKMKASKSGRYLSFDGEVINQGLTDANNVSLAVSVGGSTIKVFDLGPIEIGTRKILTVENLRIGKSATVVTFTVDPENMIKEINENNNKAELTLASY